MTKRFIPLAALLLCTAASATPEPGLHWTAEQIERLHDWLRIAPQEGLVLPVVPGLASEIDSGDGARIDRAMTELALTLARAWLLGSSGPAARAGWRIDGSDDAVDLPARLSAALAHNDIDGFYARHLATGRTGLAIHAYGGRDVVHVAETREEARGDLIERWDRDRQANLVRLPRLLEAPP